jgi:hypothetical protein
MTAKKSTKKRIITNFSFGETIAEKRIAKLDEILAQLASITLRVQRLEERVSALEDAGD